MNTDNSEFKISADSLKNKLQKKAQDIDVVSFLVDNPNPSDDVVHDWAESNGHDVDQVEAEIYKVATKYVNFISDGKANKKGFTKEDADPDELAMGIKIEQEHISDTDVAEKIALDHLVEIKDYYTRLKKMESDAGIKD